MTKRVFAVIFAVLMVGALLAGCISSDPLKGTWIVTNDEFDGQIVFNGDGTGTMESYGIEMKITYVIKGDTVELTSHYEGKSETIDLEYTIEGDKLILDDGEEPLILKKK